MKTTIELSAEVARSAKQLAARRRQTLEQFIQSAVAGEVSRAKATVDFVKEWTSFSAMWTDDDAKLPKA